MPIEKERKKEGEKNILKRNGNEATVFYITFAIMIRMHNDKQVTYRNNIFSSQFFFHLK